MIAESSSSLSNATMKLFQTAGLRFPPRKKFDSLHKSLARTGDARLIRVCRSRFEIKTKTAYAPPTHPRYLGGLVRRLTLAYQALPQCPDVPEHHPILADQR